MKICLLAKYPPIQGGVSSRVFHTVGDLLTVGHEVDLITHANEVEYGFRQMSLPGDVEQCDQRGANFRLHTLSKSDHSRGHIPYGHLYTESLVNRGLEVIAESRPDLIVGWYFQPFGVAAAALSGLTGIPYMLLHAGSDLGRLAFHPNLNTLYKRMVQGAVAIGSPDRADTSELFAKLGARPEQMISLIGSKALSPSFLGNDRIDWVEIKKRAEGFFTSYPLNQQTQGQILALNANSVPEGVPTLGIFGKVGETKGTFDLMKALKLLALSGEQFHFVSLPAGCPATMKNFVDEIFACPALAERSSILPPLFPWRIPAFLRSVDIAFALERDFDLALHSPNLVREILAGGASLVLSRELAKKGSASVVATDGENCTVVETPQNIEELAAKIRLLIRNREVRRARARRGRATSQVLEEHLTQVRGRNTIVCAIEQAYMRSLK